LLWLPAELDQLVESIASKGATPLVVAEGTQIVGVVVLEDVLKPAMSERFERLRRMGLRTIMITGDNPLTAATIAKKAGVEGTLPWLKTIDVMHLHSPTSAILSAVIFNALIIPALIPVALKGVTNRPLGADALLRRNLLQG
jgi:high-affinity K+ transport system ATPase subunit B